MHPLIKWSGGKADELPVIRQYLPDAYDTYVEPFAGGAALFWDLCPKKAVLNDIHPELMQFYGRVKEPEGCARIAQFMAENPNDEETYYRVRDEYPVSPERFYYLRKTCFRGMLRYNKQGKFNIPFGRYKSINAEDMQNPAYEQALQGTLLLCKDAVDVMKEYDDPSTFIFLDPPYDSKFTDYGYCCFAEDHQRKLAAAFRESKSKCLMVIGDTPLIRELYDGYITHSYKKNYRFRLHSGRVGDEINTQHLVIKNF